jgi:hypothetical protein
MGLQKRPGWPPAVQHTADAMLTAESSYAHIERSADNIAPNTAEWGLSE